MKYLNPPSSIKAKPASTNTDDGAKAMNSNRKRTTTKAKREERMNSFE